MDSRSDLSDPEDLPPVPFLLSARRDVMVLSSDSDGEPSGVAAPRDLPGAGPPPPKKAKKSPEHVTVRIDPGLLQGGCGGQVLSALQTQETPCVIQKQPVPRSITWSRAGEDTQVRVSAGLRGGGWISPLLVCLSLSAFRGLPPAWKKLRF
ncbi:hypothetical protein FKM82_027506 [Ascaphus truei]